MKKNPKIDGSRLKLLDTAKDRRKTLKTEKEKRNVRKSQKTTINIFLNLLSYHITRKIYILLEKFFDKLNSYCNICITSLRGWLLYALVL